MEPEDYRELPRGVLTKQQREHLLGFLDEDPAEDRDKIRMREHRIKKHIRAALLDFALLERTLTRHPWIKTAIDPGYDTEISDSGVEFIRDVEDGELSAGIGNTFRLFYQVLTPVERPGNPTEFTLELSQSVHRALDRMDVERDVSGRYSVFFDVEEQEVLDLSEVKAAYDRGEFLLEKEINQLYWAGMISYDESVEALQRQGFESLEDEPKYSERYRELRDERIEQRQQTAARDE